MQNFRDFMGQALSEAGLADELVTSALEKLYANEKLSPKLNNLVKVATEDYNAQLGRAAAAQARNDKLEKEWYPAANAEYQRVVAELTRLQQQGVSQQEIQSNFDASKYVSKEDLAAYQRESSMRFASVIKDTSEITASHVARFKEKPDLSAIDKLAIEQNLPLIAAYEKWIEPRMKEEQEKEREQWKKDQRAEIERDIKSRYKLPAEQTPGDTAPVYNRQAKEDLPKDVDQDLLNTWRGVPAKA